MAERDSLLDPDGRYQSDGPTKVEVCAERVLRLMPEARVERTRDAFQFSYDDEVSGAIVLVTAEALELRLPTVEWTRGAYGPAPGSRLWKRIRWDGLPDDVLARWIEAARKATGRQARTCHFCKRRFGPGRVSTYDGQVACHGCATARLGIVY
jgi:hypothetical protein